MGDMDRILAGDPDRYAETSAGGGKLFRRQGAVNAATLLIAVLALLSTACFRPPRALVDPPPGDYTGRSGDPRNAAFLAEGVPAEVEVAFIETLGRALPETALVQEDLLITVVSGGSIVTASAASGRRYWSRRFNGSIAGRPLRVGNRIIFATQHRDGSVMALDIRRGRRVWEHELDARPAAEPAFADGFVYVATDDGVLHALHAERGSAMWQVRIGMLADQPPLVIGDDVIVAARDTLYRVTRANGAVAARHPIAGAPTAPIAAHGDTVIVVTQTGTVAAYGERGARELWRHEVEAPVLAMPVIADDGVYVLTRGADVWRITARSAERIAQLDGAATESLTVTADGILVGQLDGVVTFLRRDGRPVWRERMPGSVRAPAAVRDSAVYITTLNGRIVKLTS